MTLRLSPADEAMARGGVGAATAFAMGVIVSFARAIGAGTLLDITKAHIDGCLYHGQVNLDFVERLKSPYRFVRAPITELANTMACRRARSRGDAQHAAHL